MMKYKLHKNDALELLEDPDANDMQADKVVSYLTTILKGVDHALSD